MLELFIPRARFPSAAELSYDIHTEVASEDIPTGPITEMACPRLRPTLLGVLLRASGVRSAVVGEEGEGSRSREVGSIVTRSARYSAQPWNIFSLLRLLCTIRFMESKQGVVIRHKTIIWSTFMYRALLSHHCYMLSSPPSILPSSV